MGFWDFLYCPSKLRSVETQLKLQKDLTTQAEAQVELLNTVHDLHVKQNRLLTGQYLKYKLLYEEALSYDERTIHIADLSEHIPDSYRELTPWDAGLGEYSLEVADPSYYAFTRDEWTLILRAVYESVEESMPGWTEDIFDCDNIAEVYHAFACLAFQRAGLERQGAVAIAWSRKHAYNVYITSSLETYIYEPQSGVEKGLVYESDDPSDIFATRKIWFIG